MLRHMLAWLPKIIYDMLKDILLFNTVERLLPHGHEPEVFGPCTDVLLSELYYKLMAVNNQT